MGTIVGSIDLAQVVLYGFWVFFAGLILYLRREDKREGYPLESDIPERRNNVRMVGFPDMPAPKTFQLHNGHTVQAPHSRPERASLAAEPIGAWPGAPLEPTGNPMLDGVGPAAWAEREDVPELTLDGRPVIVPMRVDETFSVAVEDSAQILVVPHPPRIPGLPAAQPTTSTNPLSNQHRRTSENRRNQWHATTSATSIKRNSGW